MITSQNTNSRTVNLSTRDDMNKAFANLGINNNRRSSRDSEQPVLFSDSLVRTNTNFLYDNQPNIFNEPGPSTAINMKTGASVFSLDFPSDSGIASSKSKGNRFTKRKPKFMKGSTQAAVSGVERGKRNSLKGSKVDEEWFSDCFGQNNDPAFCVTPLLTSRVDRNGRFNGFSDDEESTDSDTLSQVLKSTKYLVFFPNNAFHIRCIKYFLLSLILQ